MKKLILFFALLLLTQCGILSTLQKNCITKIEKTEKGNFVFCALCDSTIGKDLVNKFANDTTN